MSQFLTPLDVVCLDDGLYRLQTPLLYDSDLVGRVIVPEGFLTDFASVPRIPIVYMLWGGRAHHESAIHDYLYRIDSVPVVSRALADETFREAMGVRHKPDWVRWPMYKGVRLFSTRHYHKRGVKG